MNTPLADHPVAAALDAALQRIVALIGDRPLDAELAADLNAQIPFGGTEFTELQRLCTAYDTDKIGKMRGDDSIRFGRIAKPGGVAGGFSVDLVHMQPVAGPHHIHTTGEIGAIMPLGAGVAFDGIQPGWYVYPAGSDHHPTVTGASAYVLYLLPDGAIEFTGR